MSFELLLEIVHSDTTDFWKQRNEDALKRLSERLSLRKIFFSIQIVNPRPLASEEDR